MFDSCRGRYSAAAAAAKYSSAFFVFVSYAQVMGYGLDQMKALSNADAPLNTLSIRFISRDFAVAVDLAAAVSAFSATLGALSAAARMLFALGRAGLGPRIGDVDPLSGTPKFAVLLCGGLSLLGIALWAPFVGAANYYDYLGTIGTLGLILVYMGVTGAVLAVALKARHRLWALDPGRRSGQSGAPRGRREAAAQGRRARHGGRCHGAAGRAGGIPRLPRA